VRTRIEPPSMPIDGGSFERRDEYASGESVYDGLQSPGLILVAGN
jgi:hypothetical protein